MYIMSLYQLLNKYVLGKSCVDKYTVFITLTSRRKQTDLTTRAFAVVIMFIFTQSMNVSIHYTFTVIIQTTYAIVMKIFCFTIIIIL